MKNGSFIFLLLFLLLFIAPLWVRPLINPDETRYAEITREMIESGNYVSPKLNGVRYFEKPVMGYWMFAGSMKVFGENSFAMRLPSALAAGLSAWIIFMLAAHFAGGYRIGFLSASMYLTMPMVFILGSVAILDGMFALFVTACTALFFYAASDYQDRRWRQLPLLLAAGAFAGCAFLTKGFLAFVLPGLTAVAWLCWEKRWKDLLVMPWAPLCGAAAVIAPWAAAIHIQEPDYWRYFVIVEHWNRMTGGAEAQHPEPFYYFIAVLLIGAVTWWVLAPPAIRGIKQLIGKNSFIRFCICWTFVPLLFLSCSSGKLPPYILPCFAPLAMLFAVGLYKSVIAEHRVQWLRGMSLALCIALIIAAAGLTVYQFTGFPVGKPLFAKGELWKWILIMIAGILSMLSFGAVAFEKNDWGKLLFFIAAFTPVVFAAHFVLPHQVIVKKAPGTFLETLQKDITPETAIVSYQYPFQAVCWTFKRSDVWLFASFGEIRYGLEYEEPEKARQLPNPESLSRLIRKSTGAEKNGLLLIYPSDYDDAWAAVLPKNYRWKKTSDPEDGVTAVFFR